MIQKLKLYFDACCSTRLPVDLLAFYRTDYPEFEARHLFQDHRPDTDDPTWLTRIRDGGWIVITFDRGRDRKTYPLPKVCATLGITHVTLTPTLLNKGVTAHKNALVAVWESLFHLDQYFPGTQVRLGEAGKAKDGTTRYSLRVASKSKP